MQRDKDVMRSTWLCSGLARLAVVVAIGLAAASCAGQLVDDSEVVDQTDPVTASAVPVTPEVVTPEPDTTSPANPPTPLEPTDRPLLPPIEFSASLEQIDRFVGTDPIVRSRFDEAGASTLLLNGDVIASDIGFYSDAVSNSAGDYAYIHSGKTNASSVVYLSGTVVSDDAVSRRQHLHLGDEFLYWVESTGGEETSKVVSLRLSDVLVSSIDLPIIASQLVAHGNGTVSVAGYNPPANTYEVHTLQDELVRAAVHTSGSPLFLVPDVPDQVIVEVASSGVLGAVFMSYYHLFGPQYGEPFAFSNNDLGRITWNLSYRLQALANLYERTQDERVKSYLQATLTAANTEVLSNPEHLTTTKYSLNESDRLDLQVSTAFAHYGFLRAARHVDESTRAAAIDAAVIEFDSYESSWDGTSYLIESCIPFQRDGLPMPWNWQSTIGLMALELYDATGEERFLVRATALYDSFEAATFTAESGAQLWHYWPSFFYEGWDETSFESCNSPNRDARPDVVFSDVGHAALDVMFASAIAETSGRELLIDFDDVAQTVTLGPGSFSRFISGDAERTPPSFHFIPTFAESEQVAERFAAFVPSHSLNHYNQNLFRAHAVAAHTLTDQGEVTITLISNGLTQTATLSATDGRCRVETSPRELELGFPVLDAGSLPCSAELSGLAELVRGVD